MELLIDAAFRADGSVLWRMVISTLPGAQPLPAHPATGLPVTDMLTFLTIMNGSIPFRTAGGWGIVNQLPGEIAPMTRWARLVAAANAATADPLVKALNLSGV